MRRTTTLRPRLVRLAMLVGCVLVGGATILADPPMARADEPLRSLDDNITDKVGALDGREDDVRAAIDALYDGHRLDLFVVYVEDLSGAAAADWADETAHLTALGTNDVLLAVATGDRQYALSVDPSYPISNEQLREVDEVAIEPALKQHDWAGAAIGAADGLGAVRSQQPVTAPEITPGDPEPAASSGGGGRTWLWVVLVLIAVGVVVWLVFRRRSWAAPIEPGELPLDELEKQVGVLLIETDDAISTNEQEVGFAEAQYGAQAVEPFREVLAEAKTELNESFVLRRKLDDASDSDDASRRAVLTDIAQRLEAANERLDQQTDAFDTLRDVEKNAPEVLTKVRGSAQDLMHRLAQTRSVLKDLSECYAEPALEAVSGNGVEAASRLDFATAAVTDAEVKLESGDTSGAALQLVAAERATGQAGQLMDAVDQLQVDLNDADQAVGKALADVGEDIDEANALTAEQGGGSADLAGEITSAENVVATVRRGVREGRYDPFAALRHLQESGATLGKALSGVRDAQARAARASAALDQTVLSARSEIAAATDFIKTRRGAVGGDARSALVEAQRNLDQAHELAGSDPAAALSYAQRADQLARQASSRARADVNGFSAPDAGGGVGAVFGGQNSGNLSAVLMGGILGGMLGGSGGNKGGSGSRQRFGGAPSRANTTSGRARGQRRSRRGTSGRF